VVYWGIESYYIVTHSFSNPQNFTAIRADHYLEHLLRR